MVEEAVHGPRPGEELLLVFGQLRDHPEPDRHERPETDTERRNQQDREPLLLHLFTQRGAC